MEDIPYTVRRSARARRVRVNVHAHTGVEVVLPARAPERAAALAVASCAPGSSAAWRRRGTCSSSWRGGAARSPISGERWSWSRSPVAGGRTCSGERLLVPEGDPRAALELFYRRAARREIAPRLDRATALAGTPYSGLSIRAQRTRWASCSAQGRMSFNWRLLLAPESVLDYVVWHEVCHLEVLDHSPRFWALVERRWPRWREDREWLRRHGATLVL